MKYKSTRDSKISIRSSEAIIKGIADDGGLFVPERIPQINFEIGQLKEFDYKTIAMNIMESYFDDFPSNELKNCIDKAYDKKFNTEEIAPVIKVGDEYLLELFHGPTLAFKDMALSILPHLLKTSASIQNIEKDIIILTATSGDTGKAALSGFTDVKGTKVIVFYPEKGVSIVQKLQMITHEGNNTFVAGINGNFDDAQSAVKYIFSHKAFNEDINKSGCILSSANSINIGRLVPQIVYYFHAYGNLLKSSSIEENEKINIVVPTGNFGNILAAYIAKEMGLPVNKLICAANSNKVLFDFFQTGTYDKNREFYTTISPSMDILVSSNLERLLYFISGEDSESTAKLMESLKENGSYCISEEMKNNLRDFYGGYTSEEDTKLYIKKVYEKYGYIMDTHTSVAYSVYDNYKKATRDNTKTVIVSTASPFKFPNAVMTSINEEYNKMDEFELISKMAELLNITVPCAIKNITKKPILHNTVCNKEDMEGFIKNCLN